MKMIALLPGLNYSLLTQGQDGVYKVCFPPIKKNDFSLWCWPIKKGSQRLPGNKRLTCSLRHGHHLLNISGTLQYTPALAFAFDGFANRLKKDNIHELSVDETLWYQPD